MNLLCKIIGHKFIPHTHFLMNTDLYCSRCGKIVKLSRDLTEQEDGEMKK